MKLKGRFIAMLVGENSELRTKKTDGSLYSFNTVAILQDGMTDNLRVEDSLFARLKDMEHFKQYEMASVYDTTYDSFVVVDMQPFGWGKK